MRDPYEISIWQDKWNENQKTYVEEKIAIIGSDKMTASCRAVEPKLISNINGTNKFSFKMYLLCDKTEEPETYIQQFIVQNENTGNNEWAGTSEDLILAFMHAETVKDKFFRNPLIPFMFNERKVKVKWQQQWYDFVIKDVKEDSNGKSVTYTCEDQFISELSKNGFNIELDTELENNQGTACELGARVLDQTDWQMVGSDGGPLALDKDGQVIHTSIKIQTLDTNNWQVATKSSSWEENHSQFVPINNPASQYPDIFVSFNGTIETWACYQHQGNFVYRSPENEKNWVRILPWTGHTNLTGIYPQDILPINLDFKSDIIRQETDEAIYKVTLSTTITAKNSITGTTTTITKSENDPIAIYYSQVARAIEVPTSNIMPYNLFPERFQFAYTSADWETEQGKQLVTNFDYYEIEDPVYYSYTSGSNIIEFRLNSSDGRTFAKVNLDDFDTQHRADRLIRKQNAVRDPISKKYVDVYEVTSGTGVSAGDTIYGWEETKWDTAEAVANLLTSGKEFGNASGWWTTTTTTYAPTRPQTQLYPFFSTVTTDYLAHSYMQFNAKHRIYNTGLQASGTFLRDGLQKGQQYRFRCKMYSTTSVSVSTTSGTNHWIWVPDLNNEVKNFDSTKFSLFATTIDPDGNAGDPYFNITNTTYTNKDSVEATWDTDWLTGIFTYSSNEEIKRENLTLSHLMVGMISAPASSYWIKEIQFYPLSIGKKKITVNDTDREIEAEFEPDSVNIQSVARTKYKFYNHSDSSNTDKDSIKYLYDGYTQPSEYNKDSFEIPESDIQINRIYNKDYEKITSITAKESNRFNILQSISENFKCWVEFKVEHNEDGSIKYDGQIPRKYVRFVKTRGRDTGLGFHYGIDLKTISRTIKSDQLTTKTIVKPNSNEFGTDGFCTIARSGRNFSKANFILNFDYYIQKGMLDAEQVSHDLYTHTTDNKYIGYYTRLHQLNKTYDDTAASYNQYQLDYTSKEAAYKTYSQQYDALKEEKVNEQRSIAQYASQTFWGTSTSSYIDDYIQRTTTDPQSKEYRQSMVIKMQNYAQTCRDLTTASAMTTAASNALNNLKTKIDTLESQMKETTASIRALDLEFWKRYSKYILEGTWTSDQYYDDTLYYLDAQQVAYTSSRPQVSYNISVLRVTGVEELRQVAPAQTEGNPNPEQGQSAATNASWEVYQPFKYKEFNVGDIAYVTDPEFFGYKAGTNFTEPYREQVLISEITQNFDSPEKDSFKVQNYRTQFEDLFQKITASAQQLQFKEGEYARAASAIDPTGKLSLNTLQESFVDNARFAFSAQNDTIIQDATGITVTDLNAPAKQVKLNSAGLFITSDGGATWRQGIRSDGIVTDYLTAGSINAQEIMIVDGNAPTFRWDTNGITAFDTVSSDFLLNKKFVRFNQAGIYGTSQPSLFASKEDSIDVGKIMASADFALTWDGFMFQGNSLETDAINNVRTIINTLGINMFRTNSESFSDLIHYTYYNSISSQWYVLRSNEWQISLDFSTPSSPKWFTSHSIGDITTTLITWSSDSVSSLDYPPQIILNYPLRGDFNQDGAVNDADANWLVTIALTTSKSNFPQDPWVDEDDPPETANTSDFYPPEWLNRQGIHLLMYTDFPEMYSLRTDPSLPTSTELILGTDGSDLYYRFNYSSTTYYIKASDIPISDLYSYRIDGRRYNFIMTSSDNLQSWNVVNTSTLSSALSTDTTKIITYSDALSVDITESIFEINADGELKLDGVIYASGGIIGGWEIAPAMLRYQQQGQLCAVLAPTGVTTDTTSNDYVSLAIGATYNPAKPKWLWGGWKNAPFWVTPNGNMHAEDAEITGTIYGESGYFQGELQTPNATLQNLTVKKDGQFICNTPKGGSTTQVTHQKLEWATDSADHRGDSNGKNPITITRWDSAGWHNRVYKINTNESFTINFNEDTSGYYATCALLDTDPIIHGNGSYTNYQADWVNYNGNVTSIKVPPNSRGKYILRNAWQENATTISGGPESLGHWTEDTSSITHFQVEENGKVTIEGGTFINGQFDNNRSDSRLKHSIETLPSAYSTLLDNLRPVRYKYNNGTSDRYHTGFIAQEVLAAVESAGLTSQDFAALTLWNRDTPDEVWALRRDEFVALNTMAIQDLRARVARLEQLNNI